ncbi:MAG TPA: lytic murein transglycosylase [Candidatus Paceibacterota bacterium]
MLKRLFLFAIIMSLSFGWAVFLYPENVFALTQEEQEAEWRTELVQTEADITKWQSILDGTKANTKSLQQEAAILNAKIKQAQAVIKQKTIAIAKLDRDIKAKNAHIKTLEQQIDDGHDSMAQLLRKTNQIDEYSLPEIILGSQDISDFFSDVDTFQSVNRSLGDLFIQIRTKKSLTEKEKAALDVQKDKEADTKAATQAIQKQVQANEKQKEYLIQVNKTQEKTYAQVIADQQAKAAGIRAKLFKLAGGAVAIPFGTALTYAQTASAKTGVQPSFLLAILTQESNLGANVGQCYLTNTETGAGIGKNTGKQFSNVMKPTRDVPPFLELIKALGYDPAQTVVSCPIAGVAGWGGAMGPAQFIASTWALFADRLKSALGHFANPWDPQDAFMASAFYLDDLGAGAATYSSELRAACKYYGTGGSTCSYGRSVMNLKANIQSDIDYLNEYGVSRR